MRYVNFVIDGNNQDILVHMEEQSDGTVLIKLTVDGKPADIRGLFFDINNSALIGKLSVSGANVTSSKFLDEGVMDLGEGVNMQGEGRGPFDVGVAFGLPGNSKDMVTDTSLVLRSSVGNLTLDDLALVDFGVRLTGGGAPPKMEMTAPAAPNAINDTLVATEDTQSIYKVLANDTDADGIADFKITSVTDPEHGTAIISADGKTIIYVPDLNYSGDDSFGYTMIDGHGGGDNAVATIGVIAVADAPTITVSTAAGANVNEILVTVSAAVTDIDGSEYIDRFDFSGLPAGATIVGESDLTYNPVSTGQTLTQTFTLTLAPDTDFKFALGVSAVSKELSNGSEANTAKNVSVIIDANQNLFDITFSATNQNMWASGDAYVLHDDRFIGIDVDPAPVSTGGFLYGAADMRLKAGFQSTLDLTAGGVDAYVPYDVTINTTYNHVTDVMKFSSSAVLDALGVSFSTVGANGSYNLDFIFEWAISASLGIDYELDTWDIFSFSAGSNERANLVHLDSHDLALGYDFPFGISAELAWPTLNTSSGAGSLSSSGASDNFLSLKLDVDQFLADLLLKGVNPFSVAVDVEVAEGSVDLLNIEVEAGLNLVQDFVLALQDLTGSLIFEDGSSQAWSWGDIVLNNASAKDSNHDGIIAYALQLDQQATFNNQTGIGVTLGYSIDLLKASGSYDIIVDSGSWSAGPLLHIGDSAKVADFTIYDSTFAFDLNAQTIFFNGNDTLVLV